MESVLVSSPSYDLPLLVYFTCQYHIAYPYQNSLILVIILLYLSELSYPFPDYFSYTCRDCRRASTCHYHLDLVSILMLLKHYQQYQKL